MKISPNHSSFVHIIFLTKTHCGPQEHPRNTPRWDFSKNILLLLSQILSILSEIKQNIHGEKVDSVINCFSLNKSRPLLDFPKTLGSALITTGARGMGEEDMECQKECFKLCAVNLLSTSTN